MEGNSEGRKYNIELEEKSKKIPELKGNLKESKNSTEHLKHSKHDDSEHEHPEKPHTLVRNDLSSENTHEVKI